MAEKTIKDGLKYPFANWKRLFNFWWILTIVGIFSVIGYFVEITENLLKKKNKELPEFKGFWRLFKKGFLFFAVTIIPVIFSIWTLGIVDKLARGITAGELLYLTIAIFIDLFLAILFINYIKKGNFEAVFEYKKAWKVVSKNYKATLMTLLKQTVVGLILLFASIPVITMLVTIPAMSFVSYYFLVELYNNA